MEENHGLPKTITNEKNVKFNLVKDTYETLEAKGYTREEIDGWYCDERHKEIAAIYGYENDEGDESARVGIEYTNGELSIYGCHADVENCSEEVFVAELTDPFYLA